MPQIYTDKSRETEETALPNAEVFYAQEGELEAEDGEKLAAGWYWWACFPGCVPDGTPNGPFDTEEEATADAQDDE